MISNIFIPNSTLRSRYRKELDAAGISQLGVMGLVACEAAYKDGEEWYQAMLKYIKENVEFTRRFVEEKMHGVK